MVVRISGSTTATTTTTASRHKNLSDTCWHYERSVQDMRGHVSCGVHKACELQRGNSNVILHAGNHFGLRSHSQHSSQ
ncbi:hypothetical protein, partial [Comamonas thiooxydans]|uniref:hypothetical protein n=1 Tax=Comamonas thiooxydans TaxID=363952 RepID=UPI001A948C8C